MRTTGPHFVVDSLDADVVDLDGEDAHHLTRVLRASAGQPVSLTDGAGTVGQARVDEIGASVRVVVEQRAHVPRARPSLTVVHALPKARKLDGVVRALTELGVDRIVPVVSARTESRPKPQAAERWRALALAATKQSRRAWLPAVADLGAWTDAFDAPGEGIVLWEESTVPLPVVMAGLAGAERLVLGIGPEGGLTPEEVAATGLPAASLGATVLRTETAATVACAAVLALSGGLG